MHYAQYKHTSPDLVREMIATFPFAAIMVNTAGGPEVAQAPLTWREGRNPWGAVEFHLATLNRIAPAMVDSTHVTILIEGPGASISPSWYDKSFPVAQADRSRTAPTYNYLSLVLKGRLALMADHQLAIQIQDLVNHFEPTGGWRLNELAPALWQEWRTLIQGYRLEIDTFDLTAKFSQGDTTGDHVGIAKGLAGRGKLDDFVMAHIVQKFDGSSESLLTLLRDFRPAA